MMRESATYEACVVEAISRIRGKQFTPARQGALWTIFINHNLSIPSLEPVPPRRRHKQLRRALQRHRRNASICIFLPAKRT